MITSLCLLATFTIVNAERSIEADLKSFLAPPSLEMQQVFEGERFPNIVVSMKGTVLATW